MSAKDQIPLTYFFAAAFAAFVLHATPVVTPVEAADKAPGSSSPASGKDDKEQQSAAPLPSLAEIVVASERTDSVERNIRRRIPDAQWVRGPAATIDAAAASLAKAAKAVDHTAPERVQVFEVVDLALVMRGYVDTVASAVDELAASVRALDADLDTIAALEQEWSRRLAAAGARDAPPELLERIKAIPPRLAVLARDVKVRRDSILEALDRATRVRGRIDALLSDASERRDRLLGSLSSERGAPLWRAERRPETEKLAYAWMATEVIQLHGYIFRHWGTLASIAGLTFLLSYGLMLAARAALVPVATPDIETETARKFFRRPQFPAVLLALFVLAWQAPAPPIVYYRAVLTLIVVFTVVMYRIAMGYRAVLTLFTLAAALLVSWFQAGLDAQSFAGRGLHFVQCAAVAAALWIDMRRGRMAHGNQLFSVGVINVVIYLAILGLVLAIVADVFGHLGLGRLLRDGILRTLGLALVLNLIFHMLYSLVLVLVRSPLTQSSRIVQFRSSSILRTVRVVLHVLAVTAWVAGTLVSFQALHFVDWVRETVGSARIEIGAVTLTAIAVLLAAAVLVATWVIVKLTRMVLDMELLPRLSLTSGTAFAISAATRYLLIVAGLILAMAALGLDFSKVTLLVSAIGVGIGFGLQNMVNNFVSGLMLLGERLINIGDTVQVGSLTGVVRRIGVRSSTIRTFHGAEVIVPNGDLTSKEVINFTLSDRHRRLDINIGVAYGSDPNKVVELLTQVAMQRPDILATPPPLAAFIGFGESSLDFRLQVWIEHYEDGLAAQTGLMIAILARFEEAGIAMPFPQRDIHIRTVPVPGVPPSGPAA